MVFPNKLVREARQKAGLTQAQLGERLGMTQSAIAKLERPGANPSVDTLDRVLRGTGVFLSIAATPFPDHLDDTLAAALLRLSPEERFHTFERSHRQIAELVGKARRVDRETT